MAVARNIGDAAASIKAGKWERSRLVGVEAKGKTLAIVGLGKGRDRCRNCEIISNKVQWGLPWPALPTGLECD